LYQNIIVRSCIMSDEFDDIRKQILEDLNVIIQRVNDSPSASM